MSIQFTNAAEAFAGVAAVIVSADGQGSFKERQFLFDKMARLEPFAGYDQAAFNKLLGTISTRIYDTLPTDPNTLQLTPPAWTEFLSAVKQQLSSAQCAEVAQVAEQLAHSDQATASENVLLAQLKEGLGVG